MTQDYYTWAQFVAEVKKLIPLEAQRKGVGTSADDFLLGYIRQAVIQLQDISDELRVGHESIYELYDLVQEGRALRGTKPPQSAIRNAVFFRRNDDGTTTTDPTYDRFEADTYSWSRRQDLIDGIVPVNEQKCQLAIDPHGYTFYIYPAPDSEEEEEWALSLTWDGKKLDFKDEDKTPFTEQMALAVAYFVAANSALQVSENTALFEKYMLLYENQKPKLYLSGKENAEMKGRQ